ncbi:hypothetical protein DICSQDRAFT_138374 [Dichomitus squalens LYAD-421 SS1]|uniref:Uncharacterized protein n=1 Tax=Dichomitus squalens (strain LYAD-421) TaxID=732165 RepID=R7SUB0_DICSQ|nr:uncharacterized protein DICSQDRAFT_138374 [Dichomitus squalens LYAD-421 SS1]EJF59641.1 hypothetical protein DICSQDRAFT_138374 [Dichomitus squalens LYAD-421 SS1]
MMSGANGSGELDETSFHGPEIKEYNIDLSDNYDRPKRTSEINERVYERYSVQHREDMEKPHSVERIKLPLPKDLYPGFRIELQSKVTGEIGFQLIKAGYTRAQRVEFLKREFPEASSMRFPALSLVDRAMFPGEEKSHQRPHIPMPNRKERQVKTTLVDVIANILKKQHDWMKALVGLFPCLWVETSL